MKILHTRAHAARMSSIPVDFASGDHYAVLGVSRTASEVLLPCSADRAEECCYFFSSAWHQADIARAYRSLALRYHPDKNQDKIKDAEARQRRQDCPRSDAVLEHGAGRVQTHFRSLLGAERSAKAS